MRYYLLKSFCKTSQNKKLITSIVNPFCIIILFNMKKIPAYVIVLVLLVLGLFGYIVYDKFSFTEDMARTTAKKFFNLLMVKGYEGFQEIYPTINNGSRIVTNKLCRINSIIKREDGNYEVFASYEPSKFNSYPISIVVNRDEKVISSRGISYAYFDKTLEYGKKMGCLTGEEDDSKMEQIISSKNLRKKLDSETEAAILSIYLNLDVKGNLANNFGVTSGNVVIKNQSPYNLEYGDVSCKVNFLNSKGEVVETNDVLVTNIDAYGSISGHVFGSSNAASKYEIVKDIIATESLKSRVKDVLIKSSEFGCY
jgi:hypothetical protein